MKSVICALGCGYTFSYAIFYFYPELIHRNHTFRSLLASHSKYKPSIVAHRGGSFERQENTLPAFTNAVIFMIIIVK